MLRCLWGYGRGGVDYLKSSHNFRKFVMVNFSTTVVNDEYNPVSAIAQYIQSNVKQEHSKEGFFSVVLCCRGSGGMGKCSRGG